MKMEQLSNRTRFVRERSTTTDTRIANLPMVAQFAQVGGFPVTPVIAVEVSGVKLHFVGRPTDSILSVVIFVLKTSFLFSRSADCQLSLKVLICCGHFSSECISKTGRKEG